MIDLIEVKNPFTPTVGRVIHRLEWHEGMMLSDALVLAGISPLRHACVIDGLAIPEEMLAGFPVADGATVICMASVAGGNFAKTFAEIAVLVVASVVTYGLASAGAFGALFASAGLGNLSGLTVSLISSGIALGGNLLVNAFLSPSGGGGADSASFDPTGPKTVASGGTPIPKGYGTFRSGGNIIASYVTAEGSDNYINVLVCYGWGPAVSISDIRINNNDIADYKSVIYQTRLGTNDQTPIPYFNNIVNGYPQAVRCNAGDPVIIQGTGHATQGLEVVIQFPDGVFYSNSDGSLRSLSIAYKVEYAISGSGNWQTAIMPRTTADIVTTDGSGREYYPHWVVVPSDTIFSSGIVYATDTNESPTAHTVGEAWSGTQTVTFYNADGSSYTGPISLQGEWQICDPSLNQQSVTDWYSGYEIFSDADQGTLYHTTKIYNLAPNKYDVRVTKYGSAFTGDALQPREANNNRTGDQVWIHSVNEVQYQDLAYPNMILVGVRALATNQLSGNSLNVTALISYGLTATLPSLLSAYAADNPAVVAYDMMLAPIYGGGGGSLAITQANIDLPAWAAWAAVNDQLVSDGFGGHIKRHVFNGIFDASGTNLWKSLQLVASMSNAAIMQVGRNYSVTQDAAVAVPAQVFTSGNIIRDSMKDTWMALDDRSNRIEVTFADAARDYRTDEPCSVMRPADIQAGVEPKTIRVKLLGCTSRAQAWHWAYRKLQSTALLYLTRSFDVGVAAVACQVGSVIGVQDDITQWSQGGRIQFGSTTTALNIDRSDLNFAAGAGWTVSILHPVVLRGSATITGVTGFVLTFAGGIPAGNIMRLVTAAGAEVGVEGYGGNTITVDSLTGISVGGVVTLYDEDVIDTQPVSALAGEVLTPIAPFIQTPTADCPWVYGQSGGAFPAKLFTVTDIKKKGDLQVTIECIIYDAAVYADDTPIITETLGVPDVNAAVSNLTASEQYTMANGANGGQSSLIALGWQNGPNTVETELWIATAQVGETLSSEKILAVVARGTTYTFPAATGSIVEIRAVGVDGSGETAPWASAPIVTITVQGSGAAPADVPAFGGVSTPAGTALSWGAATNAANYELRYNSDIANTNWLTGVLLYAGSALAWTDPLNRYGCYLIKALSSASVESVNAASYTYLLSGQRLNQVGLVPGQTVNVQLTANSYSGSNASVTLSAPSQALTRVDGSVAIMPAATLSWAGNLAVNTDYIVYAYLTLSDLTLHSAVGDGAVPDTSANPASAAICLAPGNYPAGTVPFTTVGPGSGGTEVAAVLQVTVRGFFSPVNYQVVTAITVLSGGAGYTTVTAELVGTLINGQDNVAARVAVGLTVSGGAITAVTSWDNTLQWAISPTVAIYGPAHLTPRPIHGSGS